ncbi:uncharacterized protein LOC134347446 [Mobula hypostoma]|uniref:uncharacterized protein LOC134347446 n=1 Tax=Mobula hypostoma TaxID=723540 RepID=UPI002FC2E8F8
MQSGSFQVPPQEVMNPYSEKGMINYILNLYCSRGDVADYNYHAEILRNSPALGTIYSPGEEAETCFVIENFVVASDRIKKFINESPTHAVFNSGLLYLIEGSNSVSNNQTNFLRIIKTAHGLVFMVLNHADASFPRGFNMGNVRLSDQGKCFVLKAKNNLVDCCLIPPNEQRSILAILEGIASRHSECENMKCGDVDGGRDCIQYFNKDSYTAENLIIYITSSSIEDQCSLVFNRNGEVIGFHISHCHLVHGSSEMNTIAKAVYLREFISDLV